MQSGVCGKLCFIVGKKCREAAKAVVGGRGMNRVGQRREYEADTTVHSQNICYESAMFRN